MTIPAPPAPKIVGVSGHVEPGARTGVLRPRFVLRLQRTVGNREVVRLLTPRPVASTALARSSSSALTTSSPAPLPEPRAGRAARVAARWRRLLWRLGVRRDAVPRTRGNQP